MERRLAAILAADVVGYSRLVGADEEGTLAALKALLDDTITPTVNRHHGRIVKLMGDGLLAEFPSAVDSVRAAREFQDAVAKSNADLADDKRLIFRIGINLGDVVVDGDDIHGDGVNIAARLEGIAEPGGICVSAMVHDQVRDRIDVSFEDRGEVRLKNIERPLRVWGWRAATAPGDVAPAAASAKPSIAVLPFVNMSDDKEQEYLADGLTEDIITDLSLNQHLSVVSRTTSFGYKGQSPDIRQVGRDLGVIYVVEGSVRRVGKRIRTTVQLIEAHSGNHLWAKKYDKSADTMFDLQDEVIASIASALGANLSTAEFHRSRQSRATNLSAWDAVQRALATIAQHSVTVADYRSDIPELRAATARYPDYAYLHAALAWYLNAKCVNGASDDYAADRKESKGHLEAALRLGPDDPLNLSLCAAALVFVGLHEKAVRVCDRALTINPNLADARLTLGLAFAYLGRFEEADAVFDHLEKTVPSGGFSIWYLWYRTQLRSLEGEHEAVLSLMRELIMQFPEYTTLYFYMAVSLSALDRDEEATKMIRRALTYDKNLTLARMAPLLGEHPDPEEGAKRLDFLRAAWPRS